MLKLAILVNIKVMKIFWRYCVKNLNLLIVIGLALIFFFATSSFNRVSQDKNYIKWSSPDENANYFFTERFAETGQLAFFDRANLIGSNLIMPRSTRSDSGTIKPVSFLGIILIYGSIAAILGPSVIPFLTPFFAALGLIFFYLIVRRFFSARIALWSAVLLAVFPVYTYYTVRSMFHNVLFISLLLAAVYFFILALGRRKDSDQDILPFDVKTLPGQHYLELSLSFVAGVLAGLAVITRTSELLWLVPAWLIVWLFYARRLGWAKLLLFLAGAFAPLVPVAYFNQLLYGAFWHGGYNEMNRSLDDLARSSGELFRATWRGQLDYYRHYVGTIFRNVFYFGFKYEQSLAMFRYYVLEMFPVLFYGASGGFIIVGIDNIRRFKKKYLVYFLSGLVLSGLLIFYYGSWKFNDNPDPSRFTIGNSYTRYWLPIYLFLIPLAALFIRRIGRAAAVLFFKASDRVKRLITLGLEAMTVLIIGIFSLFFVLYGSEEGLVYLYHNNRAERASVETVWNLTEPDAVIITRYYDKLLWPERRVIMANIPADELWPAARQLADYYPVYYYDFYLDEAAVDYLNERKLPLYGVSLKLKLKVNQDFGLYWVRAMPEEEIGAEVEIETEAKVEIGTEMEIGAEAEAGALELEN